MPTYAWFILGLIVGGGAVWAFRGFVARTKEKAKATIAKLKD